MIPFAHWRKTNQPQTPVSWKKHLVGLQPFTARMAFSSSLAVQFLCQQIWLFLGSEAVLTPVFRNWKSLWGGDLYFESLIPLRPSSSQSAGEAGGSCTYTFSLGAHKQDLCTHRDHWYCASELNLSQRKKLWLPGAEADVPERPKQWEV